MERDAMKKYLTVPNVLTSLRIAGAAAMLVIEPFTALFFAVYTFSGLSDALDGYIARATGTASAFGAKLDSAADLLFYTVMMVRILPELVRLLPGWIWIWVGAILLLRVCVYVTAALKYRRFAAVHTYLNKATGLTVFLIPYFAGHAALTPWCVASCTVAILAAAEELALHLSAKEYCPERKTILPVAAAKKKENAG